MLWILLHWLIGMCLRQRILMALAWMLMIKIEMRLGRKKRLPRHLMKWQKRESRWQFPTRWLMMHVDNWEQNSVMMIVGEKSFGNDWFCKNISGHEWFYKNISGNDWSCKKILAMNDFIKIFLAMTDFVKIFLARLIL